MALIPLSGNEPVKNISKQKFVLDEYWGSREHANWYAELIRKNGYLARVINEGTKTSPFFAVYRGPKKR